MEAEMSRTAKLLRGSSDEEKFAGIMLSLKLVEVGKLDEKDSTAVLTDLYGLISPVFVVKLMRITEKRRLFRQTCISLIANSIQLGFSYVYRDHTIKLIDVIFFSLDLSAKVLPQTVAEGDSLGGSQTSSSNSEHDKTFELDLLLALKWIAAGATSADVYKLFSHTLERTGGIKFELPVYIYSALLDFLVDLCQLLSRPDTSENSHIGRFTLPPEEAAHFRKLIVKGFHGGAPESIRDSSLFCCLQFLNLNSSVHPTWSVEILEDKQSDVASDKGDKQGSGKFAMLLVSVIGIEVHLLLEEALALFKKPEGEPLEQSYGDLRDPKEERKKRYNEVITDACISNTSVRVERISTMIPCCMSLLTAILELLIGNEKTESESAGVVAELYWSHLPSPAILHIRQTVQNIIQKIFDFLKEISDVSQSSISHVFKRKNQGDENTDALTLTNGYDALLLRIIQKATATLCFWVMEDEDLRDPFLSNLPNILRWSAVTVHFDDSDHANSSKSRESINVYGIDWHATTSEAWTSITAGPTGSAMSGGSDDVCDVMHHVLPCLAAVSSNLTAKDELAERLCTLDKGSFFARLINIAVLLGLNASSFCEVEMTNNEQSASSHQSHPLNETDATSSTSARSFARNCQTFSSALDILECYFSWKQKEIQTLTLGETEGEALTDIFCISEDLFPRIRIADSSALSLTVKGSQNESLTRDLADVLDRACHILCDSVGNRSNESVTKEILSLNSAISALVCTLRTFSTT